jgi:hypothetical protein
MANYNTNLQNKNAKLQSILDTINALPEADSSENIELPELTNPALESDILLDKEAIDSNGSKITGTFTISEELTTQNSLIAQIQTALQDKASSSPILQEKTATENGEVTPDSGYDGLSKVIVNVETSGGNSDVEVSLLTREITQYSNPTLTKLGSYALSGTKISTLNLPSLTTIAGYAFYECTTLANLFLPALTEVPYNGCRQFKGLVKADLPSLKSIGANGFYQCTSLTALILRSTQLCTVTSGTVFSGSPIANGSGYIYVPSTLVDTYKTATNWVTFANQFRAIEDYPDICG